MHLILKSIIVTAFALSAMPAIAGDPAAGEATFKQLCATCHGPTGKGDGPAARALNPTPRDMSDAEWQESVDDEHLRTVTKQGGPAVGLAPTMTAFGHLSEEQLDNIVAYIRSLDD